MSFTTELKVPAEADFAPLVATFTADAARRGQLTEMQQDDLVAASCDGFLAILQEALAECREPIRLVAACTPVELTLSVFERGLPMDDALARRNPCWDALAARVDAVHWRSHGTGGSELQLSVNRPHGLQEPQESLPVAENDVSLAPPQEYTIRRFRLEDATGVARAFYLTYGYAYDFSAVYVPQRLIELNATGRYVSTVATTQNDEIAGHYALARKADEPIADACGAIVLPAHRGRDLLNRLRDRAEQEAIGLGLAAYYSEPVTDHARTQHASESFGAKACGLTLGEAPKGFIARHMELSTTTQRQSCMLYVKPLKQRERIRIYPPPHHQAMIASIYGELGMAATLADRKPLRRRGRFRETLIHADAVGTIEIEAVGSETAQLVVQAAQDLRASCRLGALYALLPLDDPGTPSLCEAMESYGFFFSGVGPWMLAGRDALRLQLPLTPIDLSALVVIGDFGRRLLEYVSAERDRCGSRATMKR